jgi:predicted permease
VANLLLARATGRARDLAVRAALGASGGRIAREVAAEALLVAGLGLALGILLAALALPALRASWPERLPPLDGAALSVPVLAGSAALALACALLVSLIPARVASRASALASLRASGRGPGGGGAARRWRAGVVVVEVALAVVLVSGASLLLETVARLRHAPLGFAARGALSARLDLPRPLGREQAQLRAFAADLEARVRALPGVSAAALGQALPLTGLRASAGLRIEGRAAEPNAQPDTCWRLVSSSWHEALGMAVLRGRGFDASDTKDSLPVAVVNATLARQVFGDGDPIGRRVATGLDGPPGTWVTIVGVVADTPQESVARATRPELHRPLAQDVRMGPTSLTLVARASGDPLALSDAVRREVRASRSDVAVSRVEPLASLAEEMASPARAASRVTALFGALGLLLAALGLYGVVSCVVGEETPELGVRLALGASPATLVSLVLRRSLSLAGAGLLLGLAAALASARALRGLLYGIAPHDPATFSAVCLVLLAAATLAALGPARRAARLDPASVLRGD